MSVRINYVEFGSTNLVATKAFFSAVFDWQFVDYGPEYTAFNQQGIDGGFFQSNTIATSVQGAPLVVLYAQDLEPLVNSVVSAGGIISKPVFEFPGGKRFHFIEPGGNELAVWSE